MGKYSKGVKVRDPDGEEAVIIGKESGGHRVLKYGPECGYSDGFTMTYHKRELEVVANDNEVSPCAPVFEKEYSVGDRVRFIRDNPNGGKNYGRTGEEFVVAGTAAPDWEGEARIQITHPKHGFAPAVPVSAIERLPPTPTFAKGDRALSMNGDYVTVDTDPDSDNHVWVSIGTTKWRTPVDMLAKWEPKVGDRVRYKDERVEGEGEIVGEPGYERSSYDWTVRGDGDPEAFFYADERFDFRTRLFVTADLEPLPVAEQPAAELWAPVAGKYGKTRDGRKVGPILKYSDEWFHIQSGQDLGDMLWHLNGEAGDAPSADLVAEWVEPVQEVEVAVAAAAVATNWRPAVGEKVRCVDGTGGSRFIIGDTYTVRRVKPDGLVYVDEIDQAMFAFCFEPAAPSAKFKVGDQVKEKDGTATGVVVELLGDSFRIEWDCVAGLRGVWPRASFELAPTLPIGSTVTFTATGRLSAINDNGHMQVVFKDLAPAQNSFALPARYVSAA